MKPKYTKPLLHGTLAVISLLFAIVNVYVVKSVDAFGSPVLFSISIFIELALVVGLVYNILYCLQTQIRIAWSIVLSAQRGIIVNPYVRKWRSSHSSIIKWLGRRFNPKYPAFSLRKLYSIPKRKWPASKPPRNIYPNCDTAFVVAVVDPLTTVLLADE